MKIKMKISLKLCDKLNQGNYFISIRLSFCIKSCNKTQTMFFCFCHLETETTFFHAGSKRLEWFGIKQYKFSFRLKSIIKKKNSNKTIIKH